MIEQVDKIFNQLGDLSPAMFVAAILFGVNMLFRRTPKFPNWLIPWLSVLLGMFVFPIFVPLATKFQNPLGRNIGMGFLAGLGAAMGYGTVLRFAEKKWPWLHDLINGNGHDKDDPKPPAPPAQPTTEP